MQKKGIHTLHGNCICIRRAEDIQKGIAALTKEREALETSVVGMVGKRQAIDRWLAENEAKLPQGGALWTFVLLPSLES